MSASATVSPVRRAAVPGSRVPGARHATLYLFLLPFAVLTALFGIWPIIESIRVAFTDSGTALSDSPEYVGFDNFVAVVSDPAFLPSLTRTLAYTFASVALNLLASLALALLLSNRALARGQIWFKLAVFLPVVTPDVASFVVWKWMVNQDFGAVSQALLLLHLPAFPGITQPGSAFVTLLLVDCWHHVGLYTLIFLTNIQMLDPALDEAAAIDGAGRWVRLVRVVAPQLRPAIAINGVYALIEFLKTFTIVLIMTRGGPNFSTDFVSYYAYARFNSADYGGATASATILFGIVLALATGALFLLRRDPAT